MVVSAILYITCAILVTLWTKTEASNAACGLPKAPIPIWPAGARGPANWDELWKWRSTCKDIYNITLRKMPHSSSRKRFEPTVTSDKSHHSQSTFYLPPVILYFPILRVTHSGVYGGLFARSWIFTLELILCSTVLPISDKKQGLIRLTILFESYLWWGAGFHCDRILRLSRFLFSLLSFAITRLRRELSQKSSLKTVPQCNSTNTGPVLSEASKWPKIPGDTQQQQSWKNPKLSKLERGKTLPLH